MAALPTFHSSDPGSSEVPIISAYYVSLSTMCDGSLLPLVARNPGRGFDKRDHVASVRWALCFGRHLVAMMQRRTSTASNSGESEESACLFPCATCLVGSTLQRLGVTGVIHCLDERLDTHVIDRSARVPRTSHGVDRRRPAVAATPRTTHNAGAATAAV